MPVNGYSVGRDVSLAVILPGGQALNIGGDSITNFKSKQDTVDDRRRPINGKRKIVRFFDGWSGSFAVDRQDSTLDDYFAALEAGFFAGQNEQPVSITETIQELSGALSQYRYTDVLMTFEDAGDVAGDKVVTQSVTFTASRRLKIA